MFIRPRRLESSSHSLVCFHHAGGSASAFNGWLPYIPSTWDPIFIECPGRGERSQEPLLSSIEDLVGSYLPLLEELDLQHTIFVGHSMGALIAFELAAKARTLYQQEPLLVVLAERNPSWFQDESIIPRSEWPDGDFIGLLRTMGGTHESLFDSDDFRDFFLATIRNDFRCVEQYRCQIKQGFLRKDVLVLGGQDDDDVPVSKLSNWEEVTQGSAVIHNFPGGHFFYRGVEDEVVKLIRNFVRSSRRRIKQS